MPTFEDYRQEAVKSIERMLGPSNAMSDPSIYPEVQYVSDGKLALATAQNPEATAEQWLEAVNLLKQCDKHATNAESEAMAEAYDEDQEEAIEGAAETAREMAAEAAMKTAAAAAYLEGLREGIQQHSRTGS